MQFSAAGRRHALDFRRCDAHEGVELGHAAEPGAPGIGDAQLASLDTRANAVGVGAGDFDRVIRADRHFHLDAIRSVDFVEIDLWQHPERRAEMVERAGGRTTVPQVFIDGRAIGGSDELAALERDGRLDPLLQAG